MTISTFRSKHDLEDYSAGAPSTDAAEIDAKVAAEATCQGCGHVGMSYRSFTLWNHGKAESYRAFAVCPVCHETQEF